MSLRELGIQMAAQALGGPRASAVRTQQLQQDQQAQDLAAAAGAFRAIGTPRAMAFAERIQAMPQETLRGLAASGMPLGALYQAMIAETTPPERPVLIGKADPSEFTPQSLLAYQQTGDPSRLVAREQPQFQGRVAVGFDEQGRPTVNIGGSDYLQETERRGQLESAARNLGAIAEMVDQPGAGTGARAKAANWLGGWFGQADPKLGEDVTRMLSGGMSRTDMGILRSRMQAATTQLRDVFLADKRISDQERRLLERGTVMLENATTDEQVRKVIPFLQASLLIREDRMRAQRGAPPMFDLGTAEGLNQAGAQFEQLGFAEDQVRDILSDMIRSRQVGGFGPILGR